MRARRTRRVRGTLKCAEALAGDVSTGLVYHEDYLRYDFGEDHALRQIRIRLARDLIAGYGLTKEAQEIRPAPAGGSLVGRVHAADYIAVVKDLSEHPQGVSYAHGLGTSDNPVFAGMYDAALLHVGGTVRACEEVVTGRLTRAMNLGGGFHHAMPARASGFCLFNDLAVGIRSLLEDHGVHRILYVDIDAHHADGVQAVFDEDPRVLKVSLHEDGRYLFPGTGSTNEIGTGPGRGFSVNVPLPPYTRDVSYLDAFQEIVPPLARAFRPELIVSQLGADGHALDPLTHLMLTTETYEAVGKMLDGLSKELCGGRWIATGGGGYEVTAVPRVWTLLFAAMAGRDLEDPLPVEWLKECDHLVRSVPSEKSLRDQTHPEEEAHVPRAAKRTVEELRRTVFPLHGLG